MVDEEAKEMVDALQYIAVEAAREGRTKLYKKIINISSLLESLHKRDIIFMAEVMEKYEEQKDLL